MMSNTMDDNNWGERNLKRRVRQRRLFVGAIAMAGIAFLILTLFVVPTGAEANGVTIAVALGYVAVVLVLGGLEWRRLDEVRRRIAINSLAITGLTCVILLPSAIVIGPRFGLIDPTKTVFQLAMLTTVISALFQRLRS